ncbi:uroporphyrin-III C-methyltransferase/precorrin-2 dehydrogenase/sirohydrochlorin ferrochelatase [Neisseria sp. HSC-16F19]|nr:siroheme synthase CysG [Neisseria sp. HSC-16F19]MCP2040150.1 uroporphyrin-III C-methyltransferase/precorrin-2 dehydrogenase/sirohydrochlorin ferrochelatase [Neisseria sp. HSC-16F19]
MNTFPLFANLQNRPVLVVGGGTVAARKIRMLLKAQAQVRVVAPRLHAELQALYAEKQFEWLAEGFAPEQLDTVFLAIAASADADLNRTVFQAAEARCRLCNVVDEAELCSFIVPAVIDRSPVQIAVSSNAQAPVLARLWREKLESLLPQHLGAVAAQAGQWRGRVKEKFADVAQRRRFWEGVFAHPQYQLLHEQGDAVAAEQVLQQLLHDSAPTGGSVALVGAGVGDAGLLTLKGLQHIQAADVVLYDALVSEQVLDLVRRDAEKIFVGKRARNHSVQQAETNRLLVELAQQGKRVVRLKGGDPFVFGRGAEELQALRAHGIPYVVVPGVTAALAATAYAGIPLTHRDRAQTAMLVTGHCQPDGRELHWQTLAQGNQTLVVYMGTIKAAELVENLLAHGRAADTPVAVISHGTLPTQQVLGGTLAELPQLAAQAPAPALIVVGETAALHRELAWFQPNKAA